MADIVSPWSPEIVEVLRSQCVTVNNRLHARGPCRLIANRLNKQFGTHFTKNAVISKIRKLSRRTEQPAGRWPPDLVGQLLKYCEWDGHRYRMCYAWDYVQDQISEYAGSRFTIAAIEQKLHKLSRLRRGGEVDVERTDNCVSPSH
jgi:hypothetical protein